MYCSQMWSEYVFRCKFSIFCKNTKFPHFPPVFPVFPFMPILPFFAVFERWLKKIGISWSIDDSIFVKYTLLASICGHTYFYDKWFRSSRILKNRQNFRKIGPKSGGNWGKIGKIRFFSLFLLFSWFSIILPSPMHLA